MPSATSCTIMYRTSHQKALTLSFFADLVSLVCIIERSVPFMFLSRYGAWAARPIWAGMPSTLVTVQWQMERWRYLIIVACSSRRTSAATRWATVTPPVDGPFHLSAGASRYKHRSVKQSTILTQEGSGVGVAGTAKTSVSPRVTKGS